MSGAGEWDCEGQPPGGSAIGALCFIAELGVRVCDSPAACARAMTAARQRLYARISELAAAGDPVGAYLEQEFPGPPALWAGGGDR